MTRTRHDAELLVHRDDGWQSVHRLATEAYVLIGTSATCGLTLTGPRLSPLHCAVRAEKGTYWLEDWASEEGVFLRGERVQSTSQFFPGDEIRIGGYRLELRLLGRGPAESPASRQAGPTETGHVPRSDPATDPPAATRHRPGPGPTVSIPSVVTFPPLAATRPVSTASSPAACDSAVSLNDDQYEWAAFDDNLGPNADRDRQLLDQQETIEILRAEVEQLQVDLADRDAHLSELVAASGLRESTDDDTAGDELLSRVEDLLTELQQSDERTVLLEQLLHAAEEANRARREEQQQLEQWVNEIEERFSAREAEWKASLAAVNRQLAAVSQERDRFAASTAPPAAVTAAGVTAATSDGSADQLRQLTVEAQRMRSQLQEAEHQRTHLEEQLRSKDQQLVQQSHEGAELRQERLAMAQERATLARQRAEVAALQVESGNTRRGSSEIDERVREFRQHLREIHAQEQRQPGAASLGSRLANLWARLDGR